VRFTICLQTLRTVSVAPASEFATSTRKRLACRADAFNARLHHPYAATLEHSTLSCCVSYDSNRSFNPQRRHGLETSSLVMISASRTTDLPSGIMIIYKFYGVACLASLLFMKRFCKTVFIHLQANPSKPGTRCARHLPGTNPSTIIPYGTSTNPNQKTYSSNHLPAFLQVDASPHSIPWGFVTKWVATPSGVGCLLTGC
jgi:hypothetical protein